MQKTKRQPTTIYLDPKIARAVRVKAAITGESVSDLVNDALARRLREDKEDLQTIRERAKEPTRRYEDFLTDLERDGLI